MRWHKAQLETHRCSLRIQYLQQPAIGNTLPAAEKNGLNVLLRFVQYFHKSGCLPIAAERKGQQPEPAAADVSFVSERTGWLGFAAPLGWPLGLRNLSIHF